MATPIDLFTGISNLLLSPFQIQSVDNKLDPTSKSSDIQEGPPPLGVLENFKGSFVGTGFNLIFRPNSGPPSATTFPNPTDPLPPPPLPFFPPLPPPPATHPDNVLELNLSTETLSFFTPLGATPNRGAGRQPNVFLNGVSYVQTVRDVTNAVTGKADGKPITMHFEPGLWMYVPPNASDPNFQESLVRMGSIPHGTTINAQTQAPITTFLGPPTFPSVNIHPYPIGGNQQWQGKTERSQTASDTRTARLPQDLSKFIEEKTITEEILNNPNTVLRNANIGKTITKTIFFTVATASATPERGGGTTNIAFLRGAANRGLVGNLVSGVAGALTGCPFAPNGEAAEMHATYWISTVQHKLEVPPFKPGEKPLQKSPTPPHHGALVPTFEINPTVEITASKIIVVESTQIQYSQTVLLNFNGYSWPHVSVATLVPETVQTIPDSAWN